MTDTPEGSLLTHKRLFAEQLIKIWKGEYRGNTAYDEYYPSDNEVYFYKIEVKSIIEIRATETLLM